MNVLLFDADRKWPNLALMKLSAWLKANDHTVALNFPLGSYGAVYASCVFARNLHHLQSLPHPEVVVGGPGSGNGRHSLSHEKANPGQAARHLHR